MSVFYTNVARRGNELLLRIADHAGNRRNIRQKFKPTLYLPTHDFSNVDKIGLLGEALVARPFASIRDAENYIEEYRDVVGAAVYGQTTWEYQFIAHNFPGTIVPDYNNIYIANVDIEVFSAGWNGELTKGPFPHPTIEAHTFKGSRAQVERYHRQILASHDFIREHFPGSYINSDIIEGQQIWENPNSNNPGEIVVNMNAAFPVSLIQCQDMQRNEYHIFGMPCAKDRSKFAYNSKDEQIGGLKVVYHEFTTEQDLLKAFLAHWAERMYDGWTGWNIEQFDSPYLVERIMRVLGESYVNMLSPWDIVKKRTIKDKRGNVTSYDFVGVEMMDMQQVYKKHTYTTRERYSLDWIAYCELGEKKLDYSESKSLNTLFFDDYEKYCRYGIKDVKLVYRLEQKLRLIQLMFVLAYKSKSNYRDGLGTVSPWLALCYYKLFEKGIVPQVKKVWEGETDFEGAYVMDVVPGRYRWLISKDLNSLYPHIIQQYNLGPETIVNDKHKRREIIEAMVAELRAASRDMSTPMGKRTALTRLADHLMVAIDERTQVVDDLIAVGKFEFKCLKEYNVSFTPNVQFFDNSKMSFLSEIMRWVYSERKVEKATGLRYEQYAGWCEELAEGKFSLESARKSRFWDEEWYTTTMDLAKDLLAEAGEEWERKAVIQDVLQQGLKILMNAGYGATGNVWFKEYFDLRISEAITTAGQLINKWNKKHTDAFLNKELGTAGLDYVVAGDTDSNYITLERLVLRDWPEEKDPHRIVENIDEWTKNVYAPLVKQWCQDLCDTMNGYEQRMVWEREVIASDAIWRAKKMYCMAVYDSEGVKYEKPKIKFKGLEARKSTTPEWCRERLVKCYEKLLLGDESEVQDLISGFKKEYMELPVSEVARAAGVSDIEKAVDSSGAFVSGAHYAAKACVSYNRLIDRNPDLNLMPIESGDKVFLVLLKDNNPIGQRYLAFPDYLAPELDMEKWVDYQSLFTASFIDPIQSLLTVVGWNWKKRVNLLAMMQKR
uniref:DNA-directed DNA polymerase n=1 Tax=Serratia phage Kevin TaxID=3161161 RepID=A0AAU8KZ95_9CAUD